MENIPSSKKEHSPMKVGVISAILGAIIGGILGGYSNSYFSKPNNTAFTIKTQEGVVNPPIIVIDTPKTSTNVIENKAENYSLSHSLSKYKTVSKNKYEIIYNDTTFGFIKIPSDVTFFTLYVQNGNSRAEGSSSLLVDPLADNDEINQIPTDSLLKNLGYYVKLAGKKRLIVSAFGESDQWYASNRITFGKNADNLKIFKRSKMFHPWDKKVYEMQGWINYNEVP